MKLKVLVLAAMAVTISSAPASAIQVSLYNANTAGVTQFSWTYTFDQQLNAHVVDVYEVWSNENPAFLHITDMLFQTNYVVRKHVTNQTGATWDSFANEILDPAGQSEDLLDPQPQPAFVPAGWTTSNDLDGVSFAQAQAVPRSSNKFLQYFVDEVTDKRDFLDFFDGMVEGVGVGPATQDIMSFGLRDNRTSGANQPFLVAQRPNEASIPPPPPPPAIPEPGTLLLLGLGLGGGLISRRRRKEGA